MIAAIIIIALALAWLGYESNWFTIRLESAEYQRLNLAKSSSDRTSDFESENVGLNPALATKQGDNSTPYKPSEFTPLDMPELTGSLNIICERG